MDISCDLDFIYAPISMYRKQVLQFLLTHITHGSVFEIGCGAVGHYWALAYAPRVSRIIFSDRLPAMIEHEAQRIDALDPAHLDSLFPGTLEFLASIASPHEAFSTHERIAALHTAFENTALFDCVVDRLSQQYDTILANEVFENLPSLDDLSRALSNIRDSGTYPGRLVGTSLVALPEAGSTSERFDRQRFASRAKDSGWNIEALETFNPNLFGYSEAFQFVLSCTP